MHLSLAPRVALVALYLLLSSTRATATDQQPLTRLGARGNPHIGPRDNPGTCPAGQTNLTVTIQNNHQTPLFFYVTGRDPAADGNFLVLRRQGDCYMWSTKPAHMGLSSAMPYYFINTTDESSDFHSQVDVDGNISFTLPTYVSSARLYVSQDKLRFGTNVGGPSDGLVEPSSTNKALPEYNITWQFIEFTYGEGNFVLNPSYVDFASMSLDLTVQPGTGASSSNVPGLGAGALDKICLALQDQAQRDNQSWGSLCLKDDNGRNLRAISPNQYLAIHPDDRMRTYYDDYVHRVWNRYSDQNLTINTQDNGSGEKVEQGRDFTCRVKPEDHRLWCGDADVPGEAYSFRKPTTPEIMGCVQGSQDQGSEDISPFTVTGQNQSLIVPRLCAAFTRSTLLLKGGNVQPNSDITDGQYYTDSITNHYSRIIHENLVGHIGYAFAYDDTNPVSSDNTTSNAGGVIQEADPELLSITVR